jgi:hypothetical protein
MIGSGIKLDRRVVVGVGAALMALAVACGSDDPASSPGASDSLADPIPTTSTADPTATAAPVDIPVVTPGTVDNATETSEAPAVFDWTIETVDEGTKPAIALSRDGTPTVAYMLESQAGWVKASSKSGDDWNTDTISEGYFYGPLDLAIGPDDVPHIAYHDHQDTRFDRDKGDAVHAYLDGGEWKTEVAHDAGHDGWDNRIIVDSRNVVHMTGIDPQEFSGGGVEYYSRDAAGTWTVEDVGSGELTYQFATSLAIDPDGNPHVTFYAQPGNDLAISSRGANGEWTVSTIEKDGNTGLFAQLLIDNSGRFHVSYGSQPDGSSLLVKYATRAADETEWTITEIDTLTDMRIGMDGARNSTSIALDSAGNPVIAYSDLQELKIAVLGGAVWSTETIAVATGNELGQIVSLKLDADDNAHVAYAETTRRSPLEGFVKYAFGIRN